MPMTALFKTRALPKKGIGSPRYHMRLPDIYLLITARTQVNLSRLRKMLHLIFTIGAGN